MPERGFESVTVPGAVSAWVDLSARFGKLPFPALFEPAVALAERGFHVSPVVAAMAARRDGAGPRAGLRRGLLPGGRAPATGELFVNKPLAASLRTIAETGAKPSTAVPSRSASRRSPASTERR